MMPLPRDSLFGEQVKPVKITTTLSPHFTGKDAPAGYYLLAQRLFMNGAPILKKQQYIGYNGNLFVTVDYNYSCGDSLFRLAANAETLDGRKIIWLDYTKLYPMNMGFRSYIPGRVLKPSVLEIGRKKVVTPGIFRKCRDIYYLELPEIIHEHLYKGTI
jgi:hypothetical protein